MNTKQPFKRSFLIPNSQNQTNGLFTGKLLWLFIFVGAYQQTNAQGCSDAGFCSLHYISNKDGNNRFTFSNVSGVSDGNTFVNTGSVSYSHLFKNGMLWDTKIAANRASGALGVNTHFGDITTNISYPVFEKNFNTLTLLNGLKIPLTGGNNKNGNNPYPMAYQSSLGTVDALLGLQYKTGQWEFTNAFQLPLTKQNKNTFFKELPGSKDFVSTNGFQRKADMLLRTAYRFLNSTKKISWQPNVLAIYHVANDRFVNGTGKTEEIANSAGLTLNANLVANCRLPKNRLLSFSIAAPFVVRTVRPDGLTRKFTAGIEYIIPF
jgi:hypothetical protein